MNNYIQHIAFRITTVLLVLFLVLPIATKFSHVFSHHKHEVCLGENQSHFHEIDTDCEFFKFKLNNNFYFDIHTFSIKKHHISNRLHVVYHTYLKSHQQLTSYLRGPPSLLM